MELAPTPTPSQDISIDSKEGSTKELHQPVIPEKKRKTKSNKDSASPKQRKAKRRRRAASDGDDFNVNFSKIKISESSRVLRSKAKRSHPSSFDSTCDTQNCTQSDSVSKDHSYSKASKRLTKSKDHVITAPTVHLKLFIDLTSSEESPYDQHKESGKDVDALHYYRRSNKIEIIDFDDLELSNDCHEDRGTKFDQNFNDPSTENRNTGSQIDQPSKNLNVPDEDRETDEVTGEKPNDHHDQCKPIPTDESEQNFNPRTDFEKLLAKYGDADLYLSKSSSFLEHSHWMLESDLNSGNVVDKPKVASEDTSEAPVYLDLDQNRITLSSSDKLPTISQPETGVTPMNFPSGGCFQKLGAVTSTIPRPESEYCNCTASCCLSNGLPFAATDTSQTATNAFSNFQTVFAHKIESLIRSKPQGYLPNGKANFPAPMISNSFSTSGGSIERIASPVIPKQPSTLKKFPGISVPFPERDIAPQPLAPESTQFECQNGQQPECRIHLVETPPSFTRTSQSETTQIMPRPQAAAEKSSIKPQHTRTESSRLNDTQLKTSNKPKRTRRTRAQMEIYRQELARTCSYRTKRNQRYASRTSRRIVGRNFSMEYRRVHSHPQEFLYTGLPTRVPHYIRPQAVQQHRYSETYSVNETNLFGVSSNSAEWPQMVDHFPGFSHGLAEYRSFEPLWPLNTGIKTFASTEAGLRLNTAEPYQKYQEPTMEGLQNPSSVMWNQQVRSIQLQSAYGNVQQVPVANSRILADGRRPFTPWHQPLAASLEQLSANLTGLSTNEPLNQVPYY